MVALYRLDKVDGYNAGRGTTIAVTEGAERNAMSDGLAREVVTG